jgi:hypothetical protein
LAEKRDEIAKVGGSRWPNIVLAGPVCKPKRSPGGFLTHDSLQIAAEI